MDETLSNKKDRGYLEQDVLEMHFERVAMIFVGQYENEIG